MSITGVHIDTARRWKRQGFIPGAYGQLVALRTTGDLGIVAREWSGYSIRGDRLFTREGWDIKPGEIEALPLNYQRLREYERLFTATSEQVQL